jgi:hypothetical protein
MQAVAADLEHHGQRLMTEPLGALARLALLVTRAGLTLTWAGLTLTRLGLSAPAGLGGPWLMFRHARMILCSEQVLDYEAKTSMRGAADD